MGNKNFIIKVYNATHTVVLLKSRHAKNDIKFWRITYTSINYLWSKQNYTKVHAYKVWYIVIDTCIYMRKHNQIKY